MSKSFGIVAVFIIVASTLIGGALGKRLLPLRAGDRSTDAIQRIEEDYREALNIISANYAGEIDYERLNQTSIQGMLLTLDPHSNFFTRAEFQRLREDQESRFYGIGISILRHRDGVYVQSVVEGTPAARAGLRYGDRILEVDGQDARDWSTEQASRKIRGERGEPVTLKIERAGEQAPLYLTIVRDAVPLPSIRLAFMIRPGIGYIGLTGGFTHTSADELRRAIADLKRQGMRQLILDLRNNPGGLLEQAIGVAGQFLDYGQVIVSVRGREYPEPKVYRNYERDPEQMPLVVLINRGSASASEIVAGAIQDHGRGLIVGETSFGKGLVQRVFQLPFGTGLTLTTAKYYTPYGRLIQRQYTSGSFYDYYTRRGANEMNSGPQTSRPGSPTIAAPEATPRPSPTGPAIRTAGGRLFYGGGGITPDIEVKPIEIDTPLRGRIFEAAFYFTRQLVAGQIQGLESYRIEKVQFNHVPRPTDYPVTEKVLEAFREFLQRSPEFGVKPAQVDADLEFVKLRLRDEIITAAYGSEAGTRVLLESDPQLLRAIEALPEAKRLAEAVRRGESIG
ncbi:S41 family peptidase [Pyrinomonas methylaliphatogenes]|jgi:carboxyl-terminal processing protease|uniref:C-terminal processing peptidase n=1 Tax=Pyrinomonas methylaliphatogenes TaxID=454194 RepID=A0A0B6X065_9BACT|nr:S41 family peptidase [Pyrinomonas methylaliphatogenes]MBX5478061.1 S41 family peptidase [Pyrinomonas methylaliphatogenes]CDM66918.1 C-terminal processing peptidase [Pyrinomonas methylaliphatogenes]